MEVGHLGVAEDRDAAQAVGHVELGAGAVEAHLIHLSGVRSQRSGVKGQRSGVRGQHLLPPIFQVCTCSLHSELVGRLVQLYTHTLHLCVVSAPRGRVEKR